MSESKPFTIKTTGHFSPMAVPEPQCNQETTNVAYSPFYSNSDDDSFRGTLGYNYRVAKDLTQPKSNDIYPQMMSRAFREYLSSLHDKKDYKKCSFSFNEVGTTLIDYDENDTYEFKFVPVKNHERREITFSVEAYTKEGNLAYTNRIRLINYKRYVYNIGGYLSISDDAYGAFSVSLVPSSSVFSSGEDDSMLD